MSGARIENGSVCRSTPDVPRALIGKVLGGPGTTTATLCRAVQWALEEGAQVINLSLGYDFPGLVRRWTEDGMEADLATSRALESYRDNIRFFDKLVALIQAQDRQSPGRKGEGALLVAAAGNESRRDRRADYRIAVAPPAAADDIVSVGALATAGPPHDRLHIAPFSNCRPMVCAPGVAICSAKAGSAAGRCPGRGPGGAGPPGGRHRAQVRGPGGGTRRLLPAGPNQGRGWGERTGRVRLCRDPARMDPRGERRARPGRPAAARLSVPVGAGGSVAGDGSDRLEPIFIDRVQREDPDAAAPTLALCLPDQGLPAGLAKLATDALIEPERPGLDQDALAMLKAQIAAAGIDNPT